MFKNLSPGAIGIRGLSLEDSITLARQTGFGGVAFSIQEAADLVAQHGLEYVRDLFAAANVRPGHWNPPVNWRNDDVWQDELKKLPALADLGSKLGCTRTSTWCPAFSDVRPFGQNFVWHVARFRPIAQVLKDYGCDFGIEFIGPKTSRAQGKYEFVYTLEGMMELARSIGTGNVGLLLDAWHLYTSGGSIADLDKITVKDVVVVHVNDAPRGIAVDDQLDNVRALPMETGVIDLPGFMRKLARMWYDGPVTPEPFSARINAIKDPVAAAQLANEYMDKLFQAGGVS